jgi:hypothetical protein
VIQEAPPFSAKHPSLAASFVLLGEVHATVCEWGAAKVCFSPTAPPPTPFHPPLIHVQLLLFV